MKNQNLNTGRVSVASTGLVRLLWRCGYVKPSLKPVKVIELEDGQIKVVGSCRIHQPIDQPNESYHESYEDALRRFVENGERDLKLAETELAGAKRRLASRKAMWTKHCESLPTECESCMATPCLCAAVPAIREILLPNSPALPPTVGSGEGSNETTP